MNRSPHILGLDIGGANLKAAHTNGAARTVPFSLWKHPERLTAELANLCAALPPHDGLAVTMTGELCDCFATKLEGVKAILQSVALAAGVTPIHVWSTAGHFVDLSTALENARSVAAANWLALAHFVARRFPDEHVMLIDTGSTTTDIVYLNHGKPEPKALTDTDRLRTGELVYTGLRRTPLCAVLWPLSDRGLAAEFFATMLDVYVFLELMPENPQDCETADGRPMTRASARVRLARMCCADPEELPDHVIPCLAWEALSGQESRLVHAYGQVHSGKAEVDRVVVSGSGEIIGHRVAKRWGKTATSLSAVLGPALSEAACAHAVATLAAEETP